MSENNNSALLSIKDLHVEYTSDGMKVHAVNGVDLELQRGKTLGLVGETGAGKTTIAKAILRILPDYGCKITGGEIILDDESVLSMSEKNMRKLRGSKVTMIFQDPMTALNPVMRMGDQITEVIHLHNKEMSRKECVARAYEMLDLVGIRAERFMDYPHQFSGGMKQRVVIAIALACSPDLLLADEPTTALDVTIQAQVMDLIDDLRKKRNTAMLLITHDLGVVAKACDDVAIIYAGSIMEYGTKEQIFLHPTHPYTIGLFGAIPSFNIDDEWLHPIQGLPPDPTDLPQGCPFSPRCPYVSEECTVSTIEPGKTTDGHMCRCCRIDTVEKEQKHGQGS